MTLTARILEFQGRLTEGEASDQRHAELRRRLLEGARDIVFDLRAVTGVDSAGLGFLVMCLATVERAGGELRLVAAPPPVQRALAMTRLDRVFRLSAD